MVYLGRLVCFLVVAIGASGVQNAHATILGDNGKIAFARKLHGLGPSTSDIFVSESDGTAQVQLTDTPNDDEFSPAWSPDGTRIAFVRDESDGTTHIFVINVDGSGETKLTKYAGTESSPDWSPDGSKIVFVENKQISIINSDGSGYKALGISGDSPSWSPDSSKIAFKDVGIFVMNADGSNRTKLESTRPVDANPEWSPDGSKIMFDRNSSVGNDIVTMKVDGSEEVNLTNFNGVDPATGRPVQFYARSAVWSPDGRKLLFVESVTLDMSIGPPPSSFFPQVLRVMNPVGTDNLFVVESNRFDYFDPAWQTLNAATKPLIPAKEPLSSALVHDECNGTNCSDNPRLIITNEQKVLERLKKPAGFVKSGLVLTGKLLNQSAQPIGGATIDLLQQVSLPGSVQTKVGEVKTDVNGVWKATFTRGPSRSIQFAYRAYKRDEKYAILSTAFSERVKGLISLKLPKSAKRRKKLVLSGLVAGGFIPEGGKVVELQVFFKGKYRVFKTLRTDTNGAFLFRFAFGRSYRPGVYRLRTRVRYGRDWPFLEATSAAKKIKVL